MKLRSVFANSFALAVLSASIMANAEEHGPDRVPRASLLSAEALASDVEENLAQSSIRRAERVNVAADGTGFVILTGGADSKQDADAAFNVARNTKHVRQVMSTREVRAD